LGGDITFLTPTDTDGTILKFSTADYITEAGLKGSRTKRFCRHTVFITARGSVGRLVLASIYVATYRYFKLTTKYLQMLHLFL